MSNEQTRGEAVAVLRIDGAAGPTAGAPAVAIVGDHPYREAPTWTAPSLGKRALRPARGIELVALVACAAITDLALWSDAGWGTGGLGLALLVLGFPAALLFAARKVHRSRRLAAVAALLGLAALRCAVDPTPLSLLAGFGLVFAFTITLRGRGVFLPEMGRSLLSALNLGPRVQAVFAGVGLQLHRRGLLRAPLAPVLVPLALVAFFAAVFGLANPVVGRLFGAAWAALDVVAVARAGVWVLGALLGAALLRPSLVLRSEGEAAAHAGEASVTSLAVARNALVGLNLLFLAYNVLDAAYLWAGAPPPGVTTQIYSHQGAAWLTVALVALTLVVGVMFRGALDRDPRAGLARTLAYAWLGQGLLLALGTYRRIAMHIAFSGLSDKRIVGLLGTSLVVAGLVLVGQKLRRQRNLGWLVRRQLDAFAVVAVLYAVAPTHLISARVNVARVAAGEERPLLLLVSQARHAESALALLPLLDHPDLQVRQSVAALLLSERHALDDDVDRMTTWNERSLAAPRVLARLHAESPRLAVAVDLTSDEASQHLIDRATAAGVE